MSNLRALVSTLSTLAIITALWYFMYYEPLQAARTECASRIRPVVVRYGQAYGATTTEYAYGESSYKTKKEAHAACVKDRDEAVRKSGF